MDTACFINEKIIDVISVGANGGLKAPCIEEPISWALSKGHQCQPHQGGSHETATDKKEQI